MFRSLSHAMLIVLVGISLQTCATNSKSAATQWVTIGKPVHFSSPSGEPLIASAGAYEVRYAGDMNLQLISERGGEGITVQAIPTFHNENLETLTAFSVPNESDEHHIILWMPGGLGLDAAGTYSGVQSREARITPLNQHLIQKYAQANRSSILRQQMSGSPPPPSPMPDLLVSASLNPFSPTPHDAVMLRVYLMNQGQADATLVAQQPVQPHILLQSFNSAGGPAGGTSFHIPNYLPLTIPAGGSRYVDVPSPAFLTRNAGTFYWQFTLNSFINESNTANNVAPRMPVTVRSP